MSKDTYPPDWKQIADRIKKAAGGKCERCQHPHDPETHHVLTVHHLVPIKSLCEDWNLAALCQKCHLTIQGRIRMDQMFMPDILPVSPWFQPHLDGYLQWIQRERQKKLSDTSTLGTATKESPPPHGADEQHPGE